ncbi:MAG: hypothetical protein K6E96_04530 [Bacteroidales bacterium]|nr:hypothetical protein [Bacteroidales bacterium]
MEENANLTAERSLEIITEQIERSRNVVAKDTGQLLYLSGLATMGTAVIVALVNGLSASPMGQLLWLILPFIIWGIKRIHDKKQVQAPVSLVGTLVVRTWWSFGGIVIGFYLFALIWNFLVMRLYDDLATATQAMVAITPVIILLMGMAVAITGHILKRRWLVLFGILGGLLVAFCEYSGIIRAIIVYTIASVKTIIVFTLITPCLSIFLFSLIGLVIPGLMLKKQNT